MKSYCIRITFLAWALVVIGYASPAASQGVNCAALLEYRDVCRSLTETSHCSPQLSSLCCTCASIWGESLPFCEFHQALFPTPTPSPTFTPTVSPTPTVTQPAPSPTPTPVNGGGSSATPPPLLQNHTESDGVVCDLKADSKEICQGGAVTVALDARGSQRVQSFVWKVVCTGDEGAIPMLLPFDLDQTKLPTTQAVLKIQEPKVENRCEVTLAVSGNGNSGTPVTAQCGVGVIVTGCQNGCSSTSIRSQLFTMDGSAARLVSLLKSAIRLLKVQRSLKNANSLIAKQQALYIETWASVWRIPDVNLTCAENATCSTISMAETQSKYAKEIRALTKRVESILVRINKKTLNKAGTIRYKRIVKAKNLARDAALKSMQSLPTTRSVCRR